MSKRVTQFTPPSRRNTIQRAENAGVADQVKAAGITAGLLLITLFKFFLRSKTTSWSSGIVPHSFSYILYCLYYGTRIVMGIGTESTAVERGMIRKEKEPLTTGLGPSLLTVPSSSSSDFEESKHHLHPHVSMRLMTTSAVVVMVAFCVLAYHVLSV